jgi:hypothetical protein
VIKAFFLAINGWAYWADFPTVSLFDFSGMNLSPKPGSEGACISGFCWTLLSNPVSFANIISSGRDGNAPLLFNSLVQYKPELADAMKEALDVLNGNISAAASAPSVPAPATEPTPESEKTTDSRSFFLSKKGDMVAHLATDYGLSQTLFKRWNPTLTDPIPVGSKVFVSP